MKKRDADAHDEMARSSRARTEDPARMDGGCWCTARLEASSVQLPRPSLEFVRTPSRCFLLALIYVSFWSESPFPDSAGGCYKFAAHTDFMSCRGGADDEPSALQSLLSQNESVLASALQSRYSESQLASG
eukprot:4770277-Amphidinium_carterae.1